MKHDWHKNEFRTMVAIGDSITAGAWASSRNKSWVHRLSLLINEFQSTQVNYFNVGIGGNVISTKSRAYEYSNKPAGNERVERDILAYRPDLLFIAYGFNDLRGGTSLPVFCDEFKGFIKKIRERIQPLILILGPYYYYNYERGRGYWDHGSIEILYEYNRGMLSFAEQNNCLFVDLLDVYNQADWLIYNDGVHPNDIGHAVIANKVFQVLASNCLCLSLKVKSDEQDIKPWRNESLLIISSRIDSEIT